MDRRVFLVGSALGMGAAAVAGPAHGFVPTRGSHVLRLDPDSGVWRPFNAATEAAPLASARRLRLLGPRLAAGSKLQALELDLLSAAAAPTPARHRAWRYVANRAHGNSGSSSIALPAQGVSLQLRLTRSDAMQPLYLRFVAGGWPEGDYLVRLDDAALAALNCGPSGACAPPLGVDAFLLQVRGEQDAPDLCLRADLACLAQDAASV